MRDNPRVKDERDQLAERVALRIKALERNPREVSIAASGKPDLVRDIYRHKRMPTGPALHDLAAELETTTDYLLGRVDVPDQVRSEVSIRDISTEWQGNRKDSIPVLGTGYCEDLILEGDDGEAFSVERVMLETDHVVRMIERPPALWNAREAYAIYFHGSSMEPRFYQGELGIVDPRRPPSPGDFVVVQLNNGESDSVVNVLVKQLVRTGGGFIYLKQFNPERSFRVARGLVSRMHRICGPNELYGSA